MLERSAEIDDLAGRIFLAEHFCSRNIQEPEPSESAGEVRVWMELNDFDQAPLAHSEGTQVVLRSALQEVPADRCVADVAIATPEGHWLASGTSHCSSSPHTWGTVQVCGEPEHKRKAKPSAGNSHISVN